MADTEKEVPALVENSESTEKSPAESTENTAEDEAPSTEEKSDEKQPDSTTTESKPDDVAKNGGSEAGASVAADDISYFWNAPCKRYLVKKEAPFGRKSTVPILVYDKDTPPEGTDAIGEFVKQHNLKHGDVVAFSEERDSQSFILSRHTDKEEFKFIRNPDDSNASYLTIPREVMENCDNGVNKYQNIIRECVAINLHVSPKDAFLKKKFGDGEIPHVWDFDIHFSYGELEEIYVRTPGADWEAFDAEETTLDDIKDFFESGRHYKAEFTVTVELEGEKLEEYKTKYGDEDDKNAWMESLPEIPPTWKLEKGESSGADDEYCWEWMLSGPEEDEEEVRESVAHFLRGFDHKFH